MQKIKVGILGFGKAGRSVVNEFMKEDPFHVAWVVRGGDVDHHKYASRLLGYEFDAGKIFSAEEVDEHFFAEHPVDALIDFSDATGIQFYEYAARRKILIVSAISSYEEADLLQLTVIAKSTTLLYSPNITLGVNVLMVAAQILQKIIPHADIEVLEEHFKDKKEISGTAKKIAKLLNLNVEQHVNSIRVGGIVGRHEIIFGLPNQIIRLSHESINRAAFGQGAIFAVNYLLGKPPGMYTMETIVAEQFRQNIPIY